MSYSGKIVQLVAWPLLRFFDHLGETAERDNYSDMERARAVLPAASQPARSIAAMAITSEAQQASMQRG